MTVYQTNTPRPVAATGTVRRTSWGAIFAGTVIALALMVLLTTFGIGIGAAALDPLTDENFGEGIFTGSGIYFIVTQLVALAIGGFVAARLAGIPRLMSAILHGAAVWALTTLLATYAAIMGGGAVFGAAGTLVGNMGSATAEAADFVVPDDIDLPEMSTVTNALSLDALPAEVQQTLRDNGITENNLRQEATTAFRNVFSRAEQDQAREDIMAAVADIVRSPGDAAEDVQALADDLVGGPNAVISEEDRTEALTVLETRLGITPQEAEQIVDTVQAQVEQTVDEVQATIEDARIQALEIAQATTDAIANAAFLLSLASLLGLVAAAGGAFGGRPDTLVGDRLDDHG